MNTSNDSGHTSGSRHNANNSRRFATARRAAPRGDHQVRDPQQLGFAQQYFITVPRCELSKQYVYDGLEQFCSRLVVAQESHTTAYLHSCCPGSSVPVADADRRLSQHRHRHHHHNQQQQQQHSQSSITNMSVDNNSSTESIIAPMDVSLPSTFSASPAEQNAPTTSARAMMPERQQRPQQHRQQQHQRQQHAQQQQQSPRPTTSTRLSPHQLLNVSDWLNRSQMEREEVAAAAAAAAGHQRRAHTQPIGSGELRAHRATLAEVERYVHCRSHLHIFAEFEPAHPCTKELVTKLVKWATGGFYSHVEMCKSSRATIIYITKEDTAPVVKGVPSDQLAFHQRKMDFIKSSRIFDNNHPFVSSRPNFYRYLQCSHTDYWKEQPVELLAPCFGLQRSDLDTRGNLVKQQVQEWFNACIANWQPKTPALYLWGPSNTGKTKLILDWLLPAQPINMRKEVYMPAKKCEFSWAGFDERKHRVVFFDEFNFANVDLEEWKNVIEGRFTSVRVKGQDSKIIAVRCPIICVSNHPCSPLPEVRNRVHIVESAYMFEEV